MSLTDREDYIVGEGEVLTVCADLERPLNANPTIDSISWAFSADDDTAVLSKFNRY